MGLAARLGHPWQPGHDHQGTGAEHLIMSMALMHGNDHQIIG